jgi:hypothetical protein
LLRGIVALDLSLVPTKNSVHGRNIEVSASCLTAPATEFTPVLNYISAGSTRRYEAELGSFAPSAALEAAQMVVFNSSKKTLGLNLDRVILGLGKFPAMQKRSEGKRIAK